MKKIILIFLLTLFSSLSLNADDHYLHNITLLGYKNKCIYNDYYIKGGRFYYHFIDNDKSYNTSSKKYVPSLITGYQFDTNTSVCSPESYRILNLTPQAYYFLMALTGLLVGLIILVSSVYLVFNVGGKR